MGCRHGWWAWGVVAAAALATIGAALAQDRATNGQNQKAAPASKTAVRKPRKGGLNVADVAKKKTAKGKAEDPLAKAAQGKAANAPAAPRAGRITSSSSSSAATVPA